MSQPPEPNRPASGQPGPYPPPDSPHGPSDSSYPPPDSGYGPPDGPYGRPGPDRQTPDAGTPYPWSPGGRGEPRRTSRRSRTLSIALVCMMLLLAAMIALPSPYTVDSPGPTEDTLGREGGKDLIEISGAPTYETTGQLRLVTVSVAGGPGYPANFAQVLEGWVSKESSVEPVELTYPPGQTQQESDKINQGEMTTSQESATVAALTELGYKVPATITIAAVDPKSGSNGMLEEGDVITSINGKKLVTYQDLTDAMDAVKPGETVKVGIVRKGKALTENVKTSDVNGQAILGVVLNPKFDYPVDVTINVGDIGGPSAGTMIALGIIDKMTPQDEANGQVIAGTGTIDLSGNVGAIGGIEQKMYGAKRDHATWFLAPESNCGDVVGNVPSGLHVVKVSTLKEARAAVTAIGEGKGDTLPSCSAK